MPASVYFVLQNTAEQLQSQRLAWRKVKQFLQLVTRNPISKVSRKLLVYTQRVRVLKYVQGLKTTFSASSPITDIFRLFAIYSTVAISGTKQPSSPLQDSLNTSAHCLTMT